MLGEMGQNGFIVEPGAIPLKRQLFGVRVISCSHPKAPAKKMRDERGL